MLGKGLSEHPRMSATLLLTRLDSSRGYHPSSWPGLGHELVKRGVPRFLWEEGRFPGPKSSQPDAEQGSRGLNAVWIGEEMGQESRALSSL